MGRLWVQIDPGFLCKSWISVRVLWITRMGNPRFYAQAL